MKKLELEVKVFGMCKRSVHKTKYKKDYVIGSNHESSYEGKNKAEQIEDKLWTIVRNINNHIKNKIKYEKI